ncbi:MAG: putative RDD family membrane protein YckC [Paraglaciecola sp.]|jgi:uncharacterized RDD family membrane protein YckC
MQTIEIRTTQNVTIEYELATLRDRMIAYLIDFFIVSVVYFFLMVVLLSFFNHSMTESDGGLRFAFVFLPIGFFLFYQFFSEIFNNGQSWGKKSMGIRVVRVDGQEPGLGDYLLRAIFLIVDVMMSIGTIAIILINSSPKRQRLGDLTANTTVVRSKKNMQFQLGDILKISSLEDYEPQFPQVKNLNESDMLLIKNAVFRYQKYRNPAHAEVIRDLVNHLKEVLDINEQPKNKVEFLKTLIRDYIVLTR